MLLVYRLKDNYMDWAQIMRGSHWAMHTKVY